MSRTRLTFVTFVLLALAASASLAHSRHKTREKAQGTPGVFDYYVLSLSWSPQFCASARQGAADAQCAAGRRFGFVVHGLWPQFERGWPEACSAEPVDDALVGRMLDIMPSRQLVRHEWEKHGTCSGLPPAAYFERIRDVRKRLRVPPAFEGPSATVNTTAAGFKRAFLEANPQLKADGIAIFCSGRFLSEVRVCLGKDLSPRRCGADVRGQCKAPEIIVRPVR